MARSMAVSVSWGLPVEEPDPLEIDVYPVDIDFYHYGNFTAMEIDFFLSPWKLILTTS